MKAARHDLETVLYGTLQPWSLVLSDIESLSNVNLLKSEVKLNIGAQNARVNSVSSTSTTLIMLTQNPLKPVTH